MTISALILMYGIILLPLMFLFAYMPYLMRKKICFGIRIPENAFDDDAIVDVRHRYTRQVLIGAAIIILASIIVGAVFGVEATIYLQSAFVIGYILIVYSAYIRAWRQIKAIKADRKWLENATNIAIATTGTEKINFSANPLWFLVHIMVLAITVLVGFALYEQMPEMVAMNYDLTGNPTSYVTKSIQLVFFAPAIQFFMLLLFGFIYVVILKTKRNIDEDRIEESIEQNNVFKNRWLMFTLYGGLVMEAIFLFMQLTFVGVITDINMIFYVTMVGVAIMIGMIVVIAIKTGQSGHRVKLTKNDKTGEVINRDDDKYWKLGMFYFNKEDPSIFVEKRFGIGFTNNFGHPVSWIILLALIAIIIASTWAGFSLTTW